MIDRNLELDQYPQLSNRGVIQLVPTQLYADWFNYTRNDGINYPIDNIELHLKNKRLSEGGMAGNLGWIILAILG